VTLFATGDSETTAHLEYVFEEAPGSKAINDIVLDTTHTLFSLRDARDRFDVLHVHSPFSALAASVETQVPTVHTLHGSFVPEMTRLYSFVAERAWFVAISEAQKVPLTTILALNHLTTASVIHPGQVLRLPAPPKPKPSVPNTFAGRTYPDAVARAAAANRATLARRKLPSRAQMRAMVQATAKRMGVDPTLALAVAWQESGFNPAVVSPANAIGTMQVIPGTGVWASDLVGRRLDLLVPQDNVTAGVAVLAALLARAEEDDAIAGYYQGLASVRSRGMFEDTKSYVASVQAHRKRFAAELADL